MYIKYKDYSGSLASSDDIVLMSLDEFNSGGKDLMGIPVTITPDGEEPTIEEIFE